MSRLTPFRCLLVLGLLAFATSSMWAQTETPAPKKPTEKTEAPAKKYRGRLPNNYGKLGLLPKQKEQIYAIQGKYEAELDKIVEQIKKIKSDRDQEIQSVLTDAQKLALKELLAAKKKPSTTKPSDPKE